MSLEMIFSLCMGLAVVGWVALVFSPLWQPRLIQVARIIACLLALAYLAQMFTTTQPVEGGSFATLAGVTALFSLPGNVMLGWTHFLAFDLFVGSWETEDAARIGLAHWALLIPLALTFLIGPVGLLTYAAIRTIHLWRRHGRLL
jgi:hypothetical protein